MNSDNKNFIEGMQLCESGNFSGAIEFFTEALKTEENPRIYYERGLAYYNIKKSSEAIKDMDTAVELDPENPFRYSSRAFIKDSLGDLEGAIADYKKAIELDPEDAIAYNNLGLLEEKAGFGEMAETHFQKADQKVKNVEFPKEFSIPEQIAANENHLQKESEILNHIPTPNLPPKKYQPMNYLREIFYVFTRKNQWLEFIRFVKNSF